MTDLTPTDQTSTRRALRLGRMAAAGTLALLGTLAPAVAGASPAQPGDGPDGIQGNPQPCWVTDTCPPPVPCEDDPENECPPVDPCEEDPSAEGCVPPPPPPPPPGEDEPDDPHTVVVEVDAPVRATPTFTG
jgi:hypothetical protein